MTPSGTLSNSTPPAPAEPVSRAAPKGAADLAGAAASCGVAGALGFEPPRRPVRAAGLVWPPADASPWRSPIGLRLAMEYAERGGADA